VCRERIRQIERDALRRLGAELSTAVELADLVPDEDPRAPGVLQIAEPPRRKGRTATNNAARRAREAGGSGLAHGLNGFTSIASVPKL
jgi:hypothetical protein